MTTMPAIVVPFTGQTDLWIGQEHNRRYLFFMRFTGERGARQNHSTSIRVRWDVSCCLLAPRLHTVGLSKPGMTMKGPKSKLIKGQLLFVLIQVLWAKKKKNRSFLQTPSVHIRHIRESKLKTIQFDINASVSSIKYDCNTTGPSQWNWDTRKGFSVPGSVWRFWIGSTFPHAFIPTKTQVVP